MFNNLVNARDVADLVRKGPAAARKVWSRLRGGRAGVVRGHWDALRAPPTDWCDVPAVARRLNRLVSGSEAVDYWGYFSGKHLADRSGLRALSIGCGGGVREIRWARTGRFARIDAIDVSSERIAIARAAAAEAGVADIVTFAVADIFAFGATEPYDVVLGEGSLHHLAPIDAAIDRCVSALRPGGLFFIDEFVGPNRFQWTHRQIEVIRGLLRVLPADLRRMRDGRVRRGFVRGSRLRMIVADPSEAVESERLLPAMRARLDEIELRPLGGGVLHMLLHGIADNFRDDGDARARAWLETCFSVEDRLLADGEIGSDFVAGVFRARG